MAGGVEFARDDGAFYLPILSVSKFSANAVGSACQVSAREEGGDLSGMLVNTAALAEERKVLFSSKRDIRKRLYRKIKGIY
jgi:hypothetical protein